MRRLLETAGPYTASGVSLLLALASLVVLPASLLESRDAGESGLASAPRADVRSVVPAPRTDQPGTDQPQAQKRADTRTGPVAKAPTSLARELLTTLVRLNRPTALGRSPGESPRASSPTRPRRGAPSVRRPGPDPGPVTAPPAAPPAAPTPGEPLPSSPPPDAPPASNPSSPPASDQSPPPGAPPENAPPQGSQTPEPSVPIVASIGEPDQIEAGAGAGISPSRSADRSSRHNRGGSARADHRSTGFASSAAADVQAASVPVETATGGGCPPQATSIAPPPAEVSSSQTPAEDRGFEHTRSDQAEQRGERHRRG